MEGLVESIKAVGLVEPITVTPSGDKFRILTGHRRARAAKLANLREVEVLIREDDNELMRRRKSLISNVQREDIGAIELAEALQAMLDDGNQVRSQRKLAQVLGKREAWISDMLRMLSLPKELQQKLRHAEVSIPYDTLMRVARIPDSKVQSELVNLSLSGTATPALRKRIDEFNERTNTQRRKRKIERCSVCVDGYTANVFGPTGKGARGAMKAAVAGLQDRLDSGARA